MIRKVRRKIRLLWPGVSYLASKVKRRVQKKQAAKVREKVNLHLLQVLPDQQPDLIIGKPQSLSK